MDLFGSMEHSPCADRAGVVIADCASVADRSPPIVAADCLPRVERVAKSGLLPGLIPEFFGKEMIIYSAYAEAHPQREDNTSSSRECDDQCKFLSFRSVAGSVLVRPLTEHQMWLLTNLGLYLRIRTFSPASNSEMHL